MAAMLFLILQKIISAKAAFAKLCKLLLGTKCVLSSLVCVPIMLLLQTGGNKADLAFIPSFIDIGLVA
jgi:hypothetical protein